jgi:hypothetical protein
MQTKIAIFTRKEIQNGITPETSHWDKLCSCRMRNVNLEYEKPKPDEIWAVRAEVGLCCVRLNYADI